MDDSLYDEFGNYIGPEIESDRESDDEIKDEELQDKQPEEDGSDVKHGPGGSNGWITTINDVEMENQIVLPEDKKYYPTAEEVYGEDVETLVMDEDEQPLEQPSIKYNFLIGDFRFEVGVKDSTTYVPTQSNPALVRNVALVGHQQHGKTVFMDMLVEQTHHMSTFNVKNEKHMKYTDTRVNEQERNISIKAIPMYLVLEDSRSKSYMCNIMDTPGHVNFSDEMTASLRLADGAVLIVDAAEGVMVNTERAIRHAIQDHLPIVVVINKVDRLITELKLPPRDAYYKLRGTIEVINNHISAASTTAGNLPLIDPAAGNVCFASGSAGWSFTLQSFAKMYAKLHGVAMDVDKFASRLWGDVYYYPDTRVFKRNPPVGGGKRAFVQFILEPLYKIYSQVIGEHKQSVETTLAELGVTLSNSAYQLNVRPLLRLACSSVFGSASGFTDMLVKHVPSPREAAARKVDITKVEESGKHTILGTGELYPIMKDPRELYSEVEVKVADPVIPFCETVVESSSMKCFAETPNRKNKITMETLRESYAMLDLESVNIPKGCHVDRITDGIIRLLDSLGFRGTFTFEAVVGCFSADRINDRMRAELETRGIRLTSLYSKEKQVADAEIKHRIKDWAARCANGVLVLMTADGGYGATIHEIRKKFPNIMTILIYIPGSLGKNLAKYPSDGNYEWLKVLYGDGGNAVLGTRGTVLGPGGTVLGPGGTVLGPGEMRHVVAGNERIVWADGAGPVGTPWFVVRQKVAGGSGSATRGRFRAGAVGSWFGGGQTIAGTPTGGRGRVFGRGGRIVNQGWVRKGGKL